MHYITSWKCKLRYKIRQISLEREREPHLGVVCVGHLRTPEAEAGDN